MGNFSCQFLDAEPSEQPNPEDYKMYFLEYNPQDWQRGSGGAYFSYRDESYADCTIVVMENPNHGFILIYNRRRTGEKMGQSWISVGDAYLMDDFHDIGDDQYYPLGAFIDPVAVWSVIEYFFNKPTEKCPAISWMNAEEINWPEL